MIVIVVAVDLLLEGEELPSREVVVFREVAVVPSVASAHHLDEGIGRDRLRALSVLIRKRLRLIEVAVLRGFITSEEGDTVAMKRQSKTGRTRD